MIETFVALVGIGNLVVLGGKVGVGGMFDGGG